jgi:hypothetical protein
MIGKGHGYRYRYLYTNENIIRDCRIIFHFKLKKDIFYIFTLHAAIVFYSLNLYIMAEFAGIVKLDFESVSTVRIVCGYSRGDIFLNNI